jgi:predicted dehydrogenase
MLRLALIGGLPNAANYRSLAPRLRAARFTADAESDAKEALRAAASLDVDAWIIAAKSTVSDNECRLAFAAGKHVLLSSSELLSPVVLKEVAAAAEQARLRCMWGSSLRFLPSVKTMKESLAKGQLGELGLLRMHSWQSDPLKEIPGNLLSELDLACWFFDQPPSLVYANSRKSDATSATSSQDYVQIHLNFPTGGMALIDRAQVHPVRDDYFSLSLIGSSGAAYADDHHNMQLLYGQGRPAALKTGQGDLALLAQLQEFINAISEVREPQPGVTELRRAIEVHDAVTESIATGRAVPLHSTVRDDRG